jgi:four helix bundle protein
MKKNVIKEKSYVFALRVIKAYQFLAKEKKEFVLSKQMLRSGTSVGALVREAEQAQSKADFISKMNIALKEANETEYWLMLLKDSDFIDEKSFESIHHDCAEVVKLLIAIVRTTKEKHGKN